MQFHSKKQHHTLRIKIKYITQYSPGEYMLMHAPQQHDGVEGEQRISITLLQKVFFLGTVIIIGKIY